MRRNLLERKWEFEAKEGYMADAFLQVLDVFGIEPEDSYIPSYLDFSQIEFRATKDRKDQIRYVYEKYIKRKDYYSIY